MHRLRALHGGLAGSAVPVGHSRADLDRPLMVVLSGEAQGDHASEDGHGVREVAAPMWGSADGVRSRRQLGLASRRLCQCGCGHRASWLGLEDGVAMLAGCDLSVRRWVRDGDTPSATARARSGSAAAGRSPGADDRQRPSRGEVGPS